MSLSGTERGAQKAVAWLNMKFNSPQLMIQKVHQEFWVTDEM